jgi:hypothetical protein
MTIDDIKVGQTWVWEHDSDSFLIIDIKDNRITWAIANTGEVLSYTYPIEKLLDSYNEGHCRLLGVTHKIKYNMDPFKFI